MIMMKVGSVKNDYDEGRECKEWLGWKYKEL